MGKKSADPTPPRQVASAQTGANMNAAIANSYLNNITRHTPDGTTRIEETGRKSIYDPYTYKKYDVPTFTQYTELSPEQMAIKKQQDKAKLGLATLGAEQTERISGLLQKVPVFDDIPAWKDFSPFQKVTFQRSGAAPALKTSYETDFSKEGNRVEEAFLERMKPQQQRDMERLESRLASQGIRLGSESYREAMETHARTLNDARLGAILAGGKEEERRFGIQHQKAQFANKAKQAMFENTMQSALFNRNAEILEKNHEQGRIRAQNDLRNQVLQEKIAITNDPINKITALLSGSQVTYPRFQTSRMATIPSTNMVNIFANRDQQKMYEAKRKNDLVKTALRGFIASDRRVKKDIRSVGITHDGQSVYRFRYKSGGPVRMGLMANEVLKKYPEAVSDVGGIRMVDYAKALKQASRKPV
ncbi:MAG: hypothetical protein PSN37_04835 [Alphaproteobacteria bacterium]|nr:hypothetical protein [Alphaproteobacteria bacterium]